MGIILGRGWRCCWWCRWPRGGGRSCTTTRRWDGNLGSSRKWNNLLLDPWLIAVGYIIEAFEVACFIGRIDAALYTPGQRLDTIFHCRTQQRICIKLHIFIRLTFELKQPAESFLDMIQRK